MPVGACRRRVDTETGPGAQAPAGVTADRALAPSVMATTTPSSDTESRTRSCPVEPTSASWSTTRAPIFRSELPRVTSIAQIGGRGRRRVVRVNLRSLLPRTRRRRAAALVGGRRQRATSPASAHRFARGGRRRVPRPEGSRSSPAGWGAPTTRAASHRSMSLALYLTRRGDRRRNGGP